MTAPRLNAGGIIGGKYTVRSILGNGGAVITYHCVSPQGQEVAVKLYDPAVASHTTVMKSLEQAYAATNALPANSAAPIIDAGYDQPTLAPYSVTELIRLPSLGAQQRRFQPEEVVTLLKGLARSLDLAHVRNVVHGAIKPTNVFVGPNSNPVVVTDFASNLAKAAVPTQEGFVNSAPWIAPEQAQSGAVTPAADVFSAGLLVFYALTGRSYWRSSQGQTFDLPGWQQELAASRTPASARAAEVGVPLSPTLDVVLWKALSADPNDRFKSIGEFANVMEDSLRQIVGTASTMALPMVGEPPSPLPANMRNPERAAPNPSLASGATLALPVEALVPGYTPGGGVPPAPPPPNAGPIVPGGYHGATTSQQNMPAAHASGGGMMMDPHGQMMAPGMHGQQQQAMMQGAYGQGSGVQARDQGYPPPPVPNGAMMTSVVATPAKGNKAVPIVIGFTAVALLGAVGTVLALKWKDLSPPTSEGPAAVPIDSASAAATAPPATTPTPASAGSSTAASSSSADAPATVVVKIVCQPTCDEVKVDGKVVEAADLKALKLAPGTHQVEVSKVGYVAQSGDIEVKEGSAPITKTFSLKKEATASTSSPGPGPGPKPPPTGTGVKPCKSGGFIKKCK